MHPAGSVWELCLTSNHLHPDSSLLSRGDGMGQLEWRPEVEVTKIILTNVSLKLPKLPLQIKDYLKEPTYV
jgi:hypothetical protein